MGSRIEIIALLLPGLAMMRVEECSTGAPCGDPEGSCPAAYSGRMARAEGKDRKVEAEAVACRLMSVGLA